MSKMLPCTVYAKKINTIAIAAKVVQNDSLHILTELAASNFPIYIDYHLISYYNDSLVYTTEII